MTTLHPFLEPDYLRPPRLTLAGSIALADSLLDRANPAPTPKEDQARVALQEEVQAAREALAARERRLADQPDEPTRFVDGAADGAWTGLYEALSAQARLPEEPFPSAREAQELRARIFPEDSLDFLRLRYVDQYGIMTARVHRVEMDGLVPRITALVGTNFWEAILHTLDRYTAMVKDGMDGPPDDADLSSALSNLRLRIADYAVKVAAEASIDDPASVAETRSRLAALIHAKEIARRRRRGGADGADPDAPLPDDGADFEPDVGADGEPGEVASGDVAPVLDSSR